MSARMTSRELHDQHEDARNEAAHTARLVREGDRVRVLDSQLAAAVDALRKYAGCLDHCSALSGAPECDCGFDDAMLRALGRQA